MLKWRENQETIQQLTSQLQQMQEQMSSMNGSGDVQWNYGGRSSHVSTQPAMIPCSRSMLSRDKRLPLDMWNQSGLQNNVFENLFFYFFFTQR